MTIKSGDTVPIEALAGLTQGSVTRMLLEQIRAEWPDRQLPALEHRFCERKWRFDLAWPDYEPKVAIELEGGVWTGGRHVRGKGYTGDMLKYSRAAILGWAVIRVTPDQVRNGQALELVKQALSARQSSVPGRMNTNPSLDTKYATRIPASPDCSDDSKEQGSVARRSRRKR